MSEMADLEKTLMDLPKLLEKRKEELAESEREIKRLKASLEKEHPSLGKPSDVIGLNIGGERISVLRRTLTQVKGSLLESMFSGRWDESLEKDAAGNFFIDQPKQYFIPLINYLRMKQNETPITRRTSAPQSLGHGFQTMCEYYGLTLAVFPVGVFHFDYNKFKTNEAKSWIMMTECCDPCEISSDITDDSKGLTYWIKPVEGCHDREVASYQVTLGECSSAQIGWVNSLDDYLYSAHTASQGVGYSADPGPDSETTSLALDVARCGTVADSNFKLLGSDTVSLKAGTTIRTERGGKDGVAWYVDDTLVATDPCAGTAKNGVPCFTIKGSFKIDKVELEF